MSTRDIGMPTGTTHGSQEELLPASVRSGLLSMRVLVPAAPATVWEHLTRPELLAQWSPVRPERALDTVGPARSQGASDGAPVDADVLEVLDGFRLVHRWDAEELIWQLAPNGDDTQLQLVVRLRDADAHAAAAATWHRHLRRLQAVLRADATPDAPSTATTAGGTTDPETNADNDEELRARYAVAITVNNADN